MSMLQDTLSCCCSLEPVPSHARLTVHVMHVLRLMHLVAAVCCVSVCCRDDETGEDFSRCTWDLDSIKGYSVRANKNCTVIVEFNVMAGFNKICPSVNVIQKVTIGVLQICPGDIPARDYLPLRPAGAQRLGTETCGRFQGQGRTLAFAFRVNSPPNSRGKCAALRVETSDDIVQVMLLRYVD